MTEQQRYPGSMRFMHWLLAIMLFGMLGVGLFMGSLPDESELAETLEHLHMATGMLVLFLVVLRLVMRLASELPGPLPTWPQWTRTLAPAGHWALYALMFAMPITGYLMVTAHGDAINFYGLFHFPRLFGENHGLKEAMEETHEVLAWILIAAIAGHILLGVKHHYQDKDGTLRRMWK